MIGRRMALAGAALAALSLAACGDSSDPVNPPGNQTPTPVAEAAPAPAVAPPAPAPDAQPAAAAVPAVPSAAPTNPGAAIEAAPAPAAATEAAAPAVPVTTALAEPAATPAAPPGPGTPTERTVLADAPALPGAAPAADAAALTIAERLARANPADGAVYLMQCEICHTVTEGGATGIGPNLFGVVGAAVGRDTAFTYSPAFQALAATGATWTPERLDAFLAAPGAEIPGTRMGFGGFADPQTRANVIAWLATLVPAPTEVPEAPRIVGIEVPGLNPVSFVAVQADVGADQYVSLGCGSCHGADMQGGVASALVGPEFQQRWFVMPVFDLLVALRTMPPNNPEPLPDARYLELMAAILAANGFDPGAAPLRPNQATLQATGFYQPVQNGRNR